jgi:nucleoside-diphosphate-sugar epimerase
MQSLVLGGTGIVGGHIVNQLIRAGERPLALSRSPPSDCRPVTWLRYDLANPENLQLPSFSRYFARLMQVSSPERCRACTNPTYAVSFFSRPPAS